MVVERTGKNCGVAMAIIMGIIAITPLCIAKETRQPFVVNEQTDWEQLEQGNTSGRISEKLNPWEVEWDTSDDYEYPLEVNSTQTIPNLAPISEDQNWFDSDTNDPRSRSGTIPFLRF